MGQNVEIHGDIVDQIVVAGLIDAYRMLKIDLKNRKKGSNMPFYSLKKKEDIAIMKVKLEMLEEAVEYFSTAQQYEDFCDEHKHK